MNSPLIHNTADQDTTEPTNSPGRRLRLARQSKGFEIAGIASQLHLHPDKVEALEQDRYADLAGSVFVSGYIRNYARLVGLDPDPLLAAYQAADPNAVEVPKRLTTIPTEPQRETRSNDLVVRLVSLVIVLAIIGLFATWWINRSGSLLAPGTVDETPLSNELAVLIDEPKTDEPVMDPQADYRPPSPVPPMTVERTTPEAREPVASQAPDRGLAQPTVVNAMNEARQAPEEEAEPGPKPTAEPIPATVTEPSARASADENTSDTGARTTSVVMEFSGPCWVDVRDSTRTFKLFGEQGDGDRIMLEGTPPYDIVLGNTSAVRIMIDDEPFDLERHSKGNVARFQLDPNDAL